jgi:hypothetical protein
MTSKSETGLLKTHMTALLAVSVCMHVYLLRASDSLCICFTCMFMYVFNLHIMYTVQGHASQPDVQWVTNGPEYHVSGTLIRGWRVGGRRWRVEGGGWRVEDGGCRVWGLGSRV